MYLENAAKIPPEMWLILAPVMIWDGVWKAVGMWHAARNGQKFWFVALMIINSVGILPIVYLKWFQKKT
jgi:hypothetical protein